MSNPRKQRNERWWSLNSSLGLCASDWIGNNEISKFQWELKLKEFKQAFPLYRDYLEKFDELNNQDKKALLDELRSISRSNSEDNIPFPGQLTENDMSELSNFLEEYQSNKSNKSKLQEICENYLPVIAESIGKLLKGMN